MPAKYLTVEACKDVTDDQGDLFRANRPHCGFLVLQVTTMRISGHLRMISLSKFERTDRKHNRLMVHCKRANQNNDRGCAGGTPLAITGQFSRGHLGAFALRCDATISELLVSWRCLRPSKLCSHIIGASSIPLLTNDLERVRFRLILRVFSNFNPSKHRQGAPSAHSGQRKSPIVCFI